MSVGTPTPQPLGSWEAVRVVARREFSTRIRERSFWISTLVTVAIIGVVSALPNIVGAGDDRYDVAFVGPGAATVESAAQEQAEAAEARLPLQPGGDVVGERHDLVRAPERELPRVQDERLVGLDLDHPREVGLVLGGIDERVFVVVEQPEVPVEPHVDARGLHHPGLPRVERDASRVDLEPDVAVTQQHGASLSGGCCYAGRAP